jgi:hypothetical protein
LEDEDASEAYRDGGIITLGTDRLQWKGEKWIAEWTFLYEWAASLPLNDSVEQLTIVHDGLERVTTACPTRATIRATLIGTLFSTNQPRRNRLRAKPCRYSGRSGQA